MADTVEISQNEAQEYYNTLHIIAIDDLYNDICKFG